MRNEGARNEGVGGRGRGTKWKRSWNRRRAVSRRKGHVIRLGRLGFGFIGGAVFRL